MNLATMRKLDCGGSLVVHEALQRMENILTAGGALRREACANY